MVWLTLGLVDGNAQGRAATGGVDAQGRAWREEVEAQRRAGSDDVDEQRRTVSGDVDVEANEHFGLCFAQDFPLLRILLPVLVFGSLAKYSSIRRKMTMRKSKRDARRCLPPYISFRSSGATLIITRRDHLRNPVVIASPTRLLY